MKTFKYRIYPTNAQITKLNRQLDSCRWLYNHLLAKRISVYKETGKGLSCYSLMKEIPRLKKERKSLNEVHSQALQDIPIKIDLAFQAFFRRLKSGQKPGHPRFKGKGRLKSYTLPQSGWQVDIKHSKTKISKLGWIKTVFHRPLEGRIKRFNVSKTSTDKWFISFLCDDVEPKKLPENNRHIGIDMGLTNFATMDTGETVANPHFFKSEEKALIRASKAFSNKKSRKNKKRLARIYERTLWKRDDFANKLSRKIVNSYGIICVEDLDINKMIETSHKLRRKNIRDVAWNKFLTLLDIKAGEAGYQVFKVNPAYTSQNCSTCGNRKKLSLSERHYSCECCGLEIDRDHNAAKNILALGMQSVAVKPRSPAL